MTKDEMLAALPKLKRADLEAVHSVATALLGGRVGNVDKGAATLAATFFGALSTALNVTMPYSRLAGTKWGTQLDQKIPELAKWLTANFTGWDKNKVVQTAFLRMIFELLADDLKKRSLPRSIGMGISNLERIPKIIENSFPGYLEAGLGSLILGTLSGGSSRVGRGKT